MANTQSSDNEQGHYVGNEHELEEAEVDGEYGGSTPNGTRSQSTGPETEGFDEDEDLPGDAVAEGDQEEGPGLPADGEQEATENEDVGYGHYDPESPTGWCDDGCYKH